MPRNLYDKLREEHKKILKKQDWVGVSEELRKKYYVRDLTLDAALNINVWLLDNDWNSFDFDDFEDLFFTIPVNNPNVKMIILDFEYRLGKKIGGMLPHYTEIFDYEIKKYSQKVDGKLEFEEGMNCKSLDKALERTEIQYLTGGQKYKKRIIHFENK
jgi:hypothetical protein